MTLAAILGIYLLSLGRPGPGWLSPSASGFAPQTTGLAAAATALNLPTPQNQDSAVPSQTPPSQESKPPAAAPNGQTSNSPGQAKPSPARRRHRKKTIPSNCSNSPTALNPAMGNSTDANSVNPGLSNPGSANADPSNAATANAGSETAGAPTAAPAALQPCPPPKKVVRNGGTEEPTIQLTGGTTAQQALHQRSTKELNAATEATLEKVKERKLSPSQQDMVNQIKLFVDQSKTAVSKGDLEGGHNLALKAHLLCDELVKP